MRQSYKSASQKRYDRKARFGTASIICTSIATVALFGGAVAHDLGLGVVMAASWSACAVGAVGSILCLIIGAED